MKKQKKISFFLTSFSGAGGERVMLDVAEGLRQRGCDVELVVMHEGGPLRTGTTLPVHALRTHRFVSAVFSLAMYLRRKRPQTVIATSEHTHIVLLLARMISGVNTQTALRIGIPLSLQWKHYKNVKDKLIPMLSRWLYPKANALIAVSEGVARDAAKLLNIPRERFTVIYHPKDIAALEREAEREPDHPWLKDKTTPVVVSVGRLRIQKDFETLIRAFAPVQKETGARLVIFGEGSERHHLQALAAELGVERSVSLAGFSASLPANVARADVFVLSSLWEGLPGALMEAMALGVPVIATDCPYGPRELLEPDIDPMEHVTEGIEEAPYGMLVPVADADALGEGLVRLLNGREMRDKLSKAGQKRMRSIAAAQQLDAYESALSIQRDERTT